MLLVANLAIIISDTKKKEMTETQANGYSSESTQRARAIKWIPTWQGLGGFQKSLRSCALDGSSLSIGRVKKRASTTELWKSFHLSDSGINVWYKSKIFLSKSSFFCGIEGDLCKGLRVKKRAALLSCRNLTTCPTVAPPCSSNMHTLMSPWKMMSASCRTRGACEMMRKTWKIHRNLSLWTPTILTWKIHRNLSLRTPTILTWKIHRNLSLWTPTILTWKIHRNLSLWTPTILTWKIHRNLSLWTPQGVDLDLEFAILRLSHE